MTLDDLLNGARRFARGAVLAAGLGLAALGTGYAAQPLKAGPFSVDQVEAPAVATHTVRRHLRRAAMPSAEYMLPDVEAGISTMVLANLDAQPATVDVYVGETRIDEASLTRVTLNPGETKTLAATRNGAAYFHVTGASDTKNVRILAQQARSVNGHTVSETVPALSLDQMLATGEHAWLPGAANPGHPSDQGDVTSESLVAMTGQYPVEADLVLANASGNPLATKHFSAQKFSRIVTPDKWTYFGVVPDASMVKSQVIVYPSSNEVAIFGIHHDNTSGDDDTIMATPKRLMDAAFVFPVVQRLLTGVPFAQYTDLHAINPDQTPNQKDLDINFFPRNTPGQPLTFAGLQVYALTHDVFSDILSEIFHLPQSTDYRGSGGAGAPQTLLAWSKLRTAMPQGDVGAWVSAMNNSAACGTEQQYPCSLIGLNQNGTTSTTLGLINLSGISTDVLIDVHDAAGIKLGSQERVLGMYENTTIDNVLSQYGDRTNARISLHVKRSTSTGTNVDAFQAFTLMTDSVDGDTNYQPAIRGPPDVAALARQYVDKWLGDSTGYPLNEMWLSDKEDTCMWLENCGVTGYRGQLSQLLTKTDGIDMTANQIESLMLQFFDGNISNGEINHNWDNFNYQNNPLKPVHGVAYTMAPSGLTIFNISDTQTMTDIRALTKNYLTTLVQQHGEWYGGQARGPPDQDHDPTWDKQNPTP